MIRTSRLFLISATVWLSLASAVAQPTPPPPPTTAPAPTPTDPKPAADPPSKDAAGSQTTTVPDQPAAADEKPLPDAPPPAEEPEEPKLRRNFAGSIQLDYMAVPSEKTGRRLGLDGATAEVSLKIAMDFSSRITSNVKVCVACHGFEVGMAFFDVRVADELNVRAGRFTPSFGEFPVRHDPANHRTSDKPLPYDMGRMLRHEEFNEGVLPAPWVDNGLELNGTHYFGEKVQLSYAAFAVGGPRAGTEPVDFDYKLSRSGEAYYIDNNSRPVVGGQLVLGLIGEDVSGSIGASMMAGTYDPEHKYKFGIYGAHANLRVKNVSLRLEYLIRRTKMALGEDPEADFKYGPGTDGRYDPYVLKEGAYAEVEFPLSRRLTVVLREDGLRRRGNVLRTSAMRSESALLRHTAGLAIGIGQSVRIKLSYERYDFSDFEDEDVIHTGIAGPF